MYSVHPKAKQIKGSEYMNADLYPPPEAEGGSSCISERHDACRFTAWLNPIPRKLIYVRLCGLVVRRDQQRASSVQSVSQLFHGPTPRSPLHVTLSSSKGWGFKCTRSHVCCLGPVCAPAALNSALNNPAPPLARSTTSTEYSLPGVAQHQQ